MWSRLRIPGSRPAPGRLWPASRGHTGREAVWMPLGWLRRRPVAQFLLLLLLLLLEVE